MFVKPALVFKASALAGCVLAGNALAFAAPTLPLPPPQMTAPAARFPNAAIGQLAVRTPADARYAGHMASNLPVKLAITLPLENRQQLDRLIAEQQNRHSARYHRWLRPDQFEAAFGPSVARYGDAMARVRSLGLRITKTYADRQLIDAEAPPATVERIFKTQMGVFSHQGRLRYGHITPATIPGILSAAKLAVVGLDNFPVAKPGIGAPPLPKVVKRGATETARAASRARAALAGRVHPNAGSGPGQTYTPGDLQTAYDWPTLYGSTGAGTTIGVVMSNDYLDSDVNSFWNSYGVYRSGWLGRGLIDGGGSYDPTQPKNSLEITLDVEQTTSLAPGANVAVYEIPDLSARSIIDAYNAVVSDNLADVTSSSFGGCEGLDWGSLFGFEIPIDNAIAQGVAQGQTWTASSGDSGSSCPSFPASDPNVTAVGGTTLFTDLNGSYGFEFAWNGSGGTVSSLFGLPGYQSGVPGIASSSNRNIPDISMSSTNTAETLGGNSTWNTFGTSVSSPDIAALFAHEIHYKGRLGNANSTLYPIENTYGTYHDILVGCNGGYCAGQGYDNVTGLGTPDGEWLIYNYYYY